MGLFIILIISHFLSGNPVLVQRPETKYPEAKKSEVRDSSNYRVGLNYIVFSK